MPRADRVLVAAVAEAREPYRGEVELLFRTLRNLGGRISGAQAVAYFVGSVDAEISEALADLDVALKIVEPFDPRCPHANKLRMLDCTDDYDYLLALDTDIVVAADFAGEIWGSSIAAKPVDHDSLAVSQWQDLFKAFAVELPQVRYVTSFALKETVAYFNSGVLLIPRKYVEPLRNLWASYIEQLLDFPDRLEGVEQNQYYIDQLAFALAVAAGRFPIRALPLAMNFPTHCPIHPIHAPGRIAPLLIHHHHQRSADGKLLPCTHTLANRRIESVNAIVPGSDPASPKSAAKHADPVRGNFDNARFWERRYTTDLKLGSGVGSRGESLAYKRGMLSRIINELQPRSVLDIGCGDIEVVRTLPIRNYIGVDVSPSVISRNSELRPDWKFMVADLTSISDQALPSADLVICLDVLIHQHDYETYRNFVAAILKSTKRSCLVSGYQTRPRPAYASDITAYHEPLTVTMRKEGAMNLLIVGSYRDTCLVQVVNP